MLQIPVELKAVKVLLRLSLAVSSVAFVACDYPKSKQSASDGQPCEAADFLDEISESTRRVSEAWQQTWGEVPTDLKDMMDRHSVSILNRICTQTAAYDLAVTTLDLFTVRAVKQSSEVAAVLNNAPEWKKAWLSRGQSQMFFVEGMDVSNGNYNGGLTPDLSVYDGAWGKFLDCIDGATASDNAKDCSHDLARGVLALSSSPP
jgi:hypothetical protein